MPKGSGRQLYPREGSGEEAGSEGAGRSYREADMRRGYAGRGCNTIRSPPIAKKACHVDPTVMRRKQQGSPREIRPVPRKGKTSRKASRSSDESRSEAETGLPEASSDQRERQLSRGRSSRGNEPGGGNAPFKRRDRKTHQNEGPNGGRGRMALQKCKKDK